jgi:hypothetical protein
MGRAAYQVRTTRQRARALALTLGLAFLGSPAVALADVTTFPISFAVAEVDGAPVVSREWLEQQVSSANEIFRLSSVQFTLERIRPLDAAHARLEDRADRHALGAFVERSAINCFIVASLRDVDDPSLYRRGVHWRARGHGPNKHFVIVSAVSGPTVLAHELGHFFGNPHSATTGNIMSYDRGEVPPFFDEAQNRRIATFARRFLRTRELVAVDHSSGSE